MKTTHFNRIATVLLLSSTLMVSCHKNKTNESYGDTVVTPEEKRVADTLSPNDKAQYTDNMDTVTE
jgi:hypothetical protein